MMFDFCSHGFFFFVPSFSSQFDVLLRPLYELIMEIEHQDIRGGHLLNLLHNRCHCGVPELQACIQRYMIQLSSLGVVSFLCICPLFMYLPHAFLWLLKFADIYMFERSVPSKLLACFHEIFTFSASITKENGSPLQNLFLYSRPCHALLLSKDMAKKCMLPEAVFCLTS